MPSMIHGRECHNLVAGKTKLFVIGGGVGVCEVYDSCCQKFVAIKSPSKFAM